MHKNQTISAGKKNVWKKLPRIDICPDVLTRPAIVNLRVTNDTVTEQILSEERNSLRETFFLFFLQTEKNVKKFPASTQSYIVTSCVRLHK